MCRSEKVQFDTVQPAWPGIARSVDEGVSIEQYGHQLRHLDPDGTKKPHGGFGHLKAVKGVHASCICICVCVFVCLCVCVAEVLSLSYASRVGELGEMCWLARVLAVQTGICKNKTQEMS